MIKSMTGFGAYDAENDDYKVHVEIKAVNHRFLEPDFRMSHLLYPYEDKMRNLVKEHLTRGKVEARIFVTDKREQEKNLRIDANAAKAYFGAVNTLSDMLRLPRITDVYKIAAFPDIISAEEKTEYAGVEELLLNALEESLKILVAMRETEGENIRRDFVNRLETLKNLTAKLTDKAPAIEEDYRNHLQKFLETVLKEADIDQNRVIQEVAIYADKINFTEETVRLASHFDQFADIINGNMGAVGRKLDFLVQEMNREVNTIGSKANNVGAARLVVDLKSEIEKLREQLQNIE